MPATRRRVSARARMAALGTALALALSACGAGGGSDDEADGSGAAAKTDKVVAGLVAEPASLDLTTQDGAAIPQALLYNVYETLVKVDADGEIVPSLAKSWEVSDDGKTYTFELVDNAVFANGDKFSAETAAFSIDYVKTKWTTSLKAAMDIVTEAVAESPTKLVVTLSAPSNDWLYRMTTRIGSMMTEAGVADLANKPIGTGPYDFTKWNRGDSIILTRNEDYWGDKPYYKEVTLKYFKDPTALNNALLSGSINIVTTVQAPESLEQFTTGANADKYDVIEGVTNGEVVLSFNQTKAPLNDIRIRQAIRYAINHQELMDNCWAGKGTLIGSMAPPTDPWYEDRTGDYAFDPDKAKDLLKQAGKTNLTLKLRLPTLPYATACGPEVKSQLSKVGINAEIDTLEFPAAWLKTVFTDKDFDMSIVAHVEPRDVPAVFGQGDKYYTSFVNPEIGPLLKEADGGTADEQVTKMKEVEKLISDQAAADFLFLLPNLIVADKGITGIPENAIGESFDLSTLAQG